jgi:hypothetical protein
MSSGGSVYEVVVGGRVGRTVRIGLEDLVDDWCGGPETHVLRVTDQARLVALINRLHDLSMSIEQVRRCDDT